MTKRQRYAFFGGGVLIVWGSLGYRFFKYADPMDRVLAVVVGIGVTVLAVLILRGPLLPKSSSWDIGGPDSELGSDDAHDQHGEEGGGHGGSDGGDGGGH